MKFSIIVPVYNRPQEVLELLQSLAKQTYTQFEVIIVEDGSSISCEQIVADFSHLLEIKYFTKQNEGPGLTRNFGMKHAGTDYFIFFDSDCLIPENYMGIVNSELTAHFTDAYGGSDAAHSSFTPIQKAISYSMTSFITTGGIRGGKKKMDVFHPRSFNMGFSRKVYEKTGGYAAMRFGEDVDLSLRILESGFKAKLIADAFVYHKRRTSFYKFYKQVHNSGMARIALYARHPQSLKLVHMLPAAFVTGTLFLILLSLIFPVSLLPIFMLALLIFVHAAVSTGSFRVAYLSVVASFVQLFGYGIGFYRAAYNYFILKKTEKFAFRENFYK